MEQKLEIENILTHIENINKKPEGCENDGIVKIVNILENKNFSDDLLVVPKLAQALSRFIKDSGHFNVLMREVGHTSGLLILQQDFQMIFEFSKAIKDCIFYSAYAQAMSNVFCNLIDDPDMVSCARNLASLYTEIISNVGDMSSVEMPFHFLYKLVTTLTICGDYEHQYILLNLITLLIRNEKYKREALCNFLPEFEEMLDELMKISSGNFAMEARKFLNMLNNNSKLIFSMLCLKIQIGEHFLISDCDNELWVDFNCTGPSVSFYFKSIMLKNSPVESKFNNEMELFRINEDIIQRVNKRSFKQNDQLHFCVNFYLTSTMQASTPALEELAESAKIVRFIFSDGDVDNEELHAALSHYNDKYKIHATTKLPILRAMTTRSMCTRRVLIPDENAVILEKCDFKVVQTKAKQRFDKLKAVTSKKVAHSKKKNSAIEITVTEKPINEEETTTTAKLETSLNERNFSISLLNQGICTSTPNEVKKKFIGNNYRRNVQGSSVPSETADTTFCDKVDANSVYSNLCDLTSVDGRQNKKRVLYNPESKIIVPRLPPRKIIEVISHRNSRLACSSIATESNSGEKKRKLSVLMEAPETDLGSLSPVRKTEVVYSPQVDLNVVQTAQMHTEAIAEQKIKRRKHEDEILLRDNYFTRSRVNSASIHQNVPDSVGFEDFLGDILVHAWEEEGRVVYAPRTLSLPVRQIM